MPQSLASSKSRWLTHSVGTVIPVCSGSPACSLWSVPSCCCQVGRGLCLLIEGLGIYIACYGGLLVLLSLRLRTRGVASEGQPNIGGQAH